MAIHLIPKWRITESSWVELHESEASRATRLGNMAFSEKNVVCGPSFLTEEDIPGSSLNGRDPSQLKNPELKFWLKCRGDSCKGLSTKAQLCKRYVGVHFYTVSKRLGQTADFAVLFFFF